MNIFLTCIYNVENYYNVKDVYLNSHTREDIPAELKNIKMQIIDYERVLKFINSLHWFNVSSKNVNNIKDRILNINKQIDDNII